MERGLVNTIKGNEILSELEKMHKGFFISLNVEDIKEFEEKFNYLNLFEDEKILYNKIDENLNLFFGYITGRYQIFKISDVLDYLSKFGVSDKDFVYITRKFTVINSEKIYYLNSYGKFYKESFIYKPYLLKLGNIKHSKGNLSKRELLLENFSRIIENSEIIDANLAKIEVYDEFVLEIVEDIGIRTTKSMLGITNERDWSKLTKEEKLNVINSLGIKNMINLLEFVNNAISKSIERESNMLGDVLNKVSEKITNFIKIDRFLI